MFRVGLLWNTTENNDFECGATVIDYRFAITSASCVHLNKDKPHSIFVENSDEVIRIDDIFIHPNFMTDKPQNDIALLKLSKFVKHDMKFVPACIRKLIDEMDEGIQSISIYGSKYANKESFRKDDYERYTIETVTDSSTNGHCSNPEYLPDFIYCANNSINLIPTVCSVGLAIFFNFYKSYYD